MADKAYVIITARKEVPDRPTARAIYDTVKAKLADNPDIIVSGQFSNHFDLDAEPE